MWMARPRMAEACFVFSVDRFIFLLGTLARMGMTGLRRGHSKDAVFAFAAVFLAAVRSCVGAAVLKCSDDFKVHQLKLGKIGNFVYLLESGGRALTIDAAWDIGRLLRYASKQQFEVVGGLYTHWHWDHVGGKYSGFPIEGAAKLRKSAGEEGAAAGKALPLWIGAEDWKQAAETAELGEKEWITVTDGEVVGTPLGDDVRIVAVDSPGHTAGGVSFLVTHPSLAKSKRCPKGVLFTGDTLFAGSVGRTDLEGANEKTLLKSISRLSALPGEVVVLPGHDYGSKATSSIASEIDGNGHLVKARGQFPPSSLPSLPASVKPDAVSSEKSEL
eukprot:TRINITY_DN103758_c0_g1_i1.p1 TRINITY_DN103758_c0_g1~~TRINITY_DN103758_c0_g1_i1.p1  ORF type:complete len:350 (-),score=47.73 TRINITY_DN103758_c0_g1_i1:669-1658(-)